MRCLVDDDVVLGLVVVLVDVGVRTERPGDDGVGENLPYPPRVSFDGGGDLVARTRTTGLCDYITTGQIIDKAGEGIQAFLASHRKVIFTADQTHLCEDL